MAQNNIAGPDVDQRPIEQLLDRFAGSITKLSAVGYADIYRILADRREETIPVLQSRLAEADWSEVVVVEKRLLFAGYFSLLHDLDEEVAATTANRVRSSKCHPTIEQEINRISRRQKAQFDFLEIGEIQVVVSPETAPPKRINRLLTKWLGRLPNGHLHSIRQIDVVPRGGCGEDAAGFYDQGFARICLEWRRQSKAWNLLGRWASRLLTKKTLYHEVGHHVLGHSPGFRDDDRERAAETYCSMQFYETSLFLRILIRAVNWIVPSRRWHRRHMAQFSARLERRWRQEQIPMATRPTDAEISAWELVHSIVLPAALRRVLGETGGMERNVFCSNGFHFASLDELSLIPDPLINVEADAPGPHIVFAEHLPTGTKYLLPPATTDPQKSVVLRSGCNTRSGYLKIALSFPGFVGAYMKNAPFLHS